MALWKEREQNDAPTDIWFRSLLQRAGFEPGKVISEGSTYAVRAGGFLFRLRPGSDYLEAVGRLELGVRVELLKRNAQRLTDLYEDGFCVVIKKPEALSTLRSILNQGPRLTQEMKERIAQMSLASSTNAHPEASLALLPAGSSA